MAFFDEGDEPPTRAARPRRTGGSGTRGSTIAPDPQTVRQRRLIALAFAVLVFIILAIGVNACLDSRATNQLKNYNRDVATVIAESDRDVSKPYFQAISQGGQSPVELESTISQLRNVADQHVKTAKKFDTPGDLKTAQYNLVLLLDMRASALGKIAGEVRTALATGDQATNAVGQIAAQHQQFLASDVIYEARVLPYVVAELDKKDIGGQEQQASQFLPSLDWLQPSTVETRLGATGADTGGAQEDQNVPPGLHGHGLVSVAAGTVTLQPGTANHIPAGSNLAFKVTFANQGDNDERNVTVTVQIKGTGIKTITKSRRVPQTTAGQNAEATIPLDTAPPAGTPVTITVSVARVPGEKKTDNNKQAYTAIFSR